MLPISKSKFSRVEEKKKTYFIDIDGTIFKYRKFETYKIQKAELLVESKVFLQQVRDLGHMIILTTARPESLREHTIFELESNNVPYDKLIMGIERGPRYLINDMDPNKPGERAIAINVKRDHGIKS